MTTHAGLYNHLTAEHDLNETTLAGVDLVRLSEMHKHEHDKFGDDLDHSHDRIDTDPVRLQPLPITVPAELANDVLDWVEDRAACSAAEDDPNEDPWWEDSDDAAAELAHRFGGLIKQARLGR